MSRVVVLGGQWGDEGKGKIVDYLAQEATVLCRYNGGANAGHSVETDDGTRYAFHQLPAGSTQPGKSVFLARGMVIDVPKLLKEIAWVREINPDLQVFIDPNAHLVERRHIEEDARLEAQRPIGSTKTGIGPAYAERVLRIGTRVGQYNIWLEDYARTLVEMPDMLRMAPDLVMAGAHGALLDLGHGDYPFVTSSGCTIGEIGPGAGLSPRDPSLEVVGVIKAYATRVGAGPFPNEITNLQADFLREKGHEYGTTTGRPRRIAWLDIPSLNRANSVNLFDYWALTRVDVLDGVLAEMNDGLTQRRISWRGTYGMTDPDKMPESLRLFIDIIHRHTGIPVKLISTGPRRSQIIDLRHARV